MRSNAFKGRTWAEQNIRDAVVNGGSPPAGSYNVLIEEIDRLRAGFERIKAVAADQLELEILGYGEWRVVQRIIRETIE